MRLDVETLLEFRRSLSNQITRQSDELIHSLQEREMFFQEIKLKNRLIEKFLNSPSPNTGRLSLKPSGRASMGSRVQQLIGRSGARSESD